MEPEGDIPRLPSSTDATILELQTSPEDVLMLLKQLNPNKSSGPDTLPPRLLRKFANELAEPVATIFNASLETGTVPADWNTAIITGVYKKGSRKDT